MSKLLVLLLGLLVLSATQLVDEQYDDDYTDDEPLYGTAGPSSIDGSYTVSRFGNSRPTNPISVTLRRSQIVVQGCNRHTGKFNYNPSNSRWSVGSFGSTRKYCTIDQDPQVLKALKRATMIQKSGNVLNFIYSSGGSRSTVLSITIGGTSDGSSNLKGSYLLQSVRGISKLVRRVTVTIQGSEIRFKGCNTNWAKFTYNGSTRRWSVGSFASTKVFCNNDQDKSIISALRKAIIAYRRSNLLQFEDNSGVIATCKSASLGTTFDDESDQSQQFDNQQTFDESYQGPQVDESDDAWETNEQGDGFETEDDDTFEDNNQYQQEQVDENEDVEQEFNDEADDQFDDNNDADTGATKQ